MNQNQTGAGDSGSSLEMLFQEHVRDYLIERHGYRRLDSRDISRSELALSEAELRGFLVSTDQEGFRLLAEEYHGESEACIQVIWALGKACERRPLWLVLRDGLDVRGRSVRLFYPKPRSPGTADGDKHAKNRWSLVHHYRFGPRNEEIDLVLFLNGLPIVALELKHEAAGQDVDDAVYQYLRRDQHDSVLRLPFLFVASDTSKVKMSTDPRSSDEFRWLNANLVNTPDTKGEFAIEHLYRDVLSPDQLSEAISSFLVRGSDSRTIFPRYHQSRMVRRLSSDALGHFTASGDIGKKYLVRHSAGSGKTLSICWLAERLHSLFNMSDGRKLTDTVFIITDRRSLDKNIRDELSGFAHLKDIVGYAKKAEDLRKHLKANTPIIVSTIQKFSWILEKLQADESLQTRRVAFLIDEAHRSQDNKLGDALRSPFRTDPASSVFDDSEEEEEPDEDELAEAIRRHDRNQLFVAFTATPSQTTGELFGASFDDYSEAQAIAEGYILDVADKIISYKTLYNVAWRERPISGSAKEYPKSIVSRALRAMAYEDTEIIQFKAEEMLTLFEKSVSSLIDGQAKAMIVASSRLAGLRYYRTIAAKLRERGSEYKALFAFSDFSCKEESDPAEVVKTEAEINSLAKGESIEDRFARSEYRILIVANKFQTGFDEPLLAGMFLDKMVADRNAVQTVSRLNRCWPHKESVVVVDFTNNAEAIIKAFQKYRGASPHAPREPEAKECTDLYNQIMGLGVIRLEDVTLYRSVMHPRGNALAQGVAISIRKGLESSIPNPDERRAHVSLMERFLERYYFLSSIFSFPEEINSAALFFEYLVPQLLLRGGQEELNTLLSHLYLPKATVLYVGEKKNDQKKRPHGGGGSGGPGGRPPRASLDEVMADLRQLYQISDNEALLIREVTESKIEDNGIRIEVERNRANHLYLSGPYRKQMNNDIQESYNERGHSDELGDQRYVGAGGIFDFMAITIIDHHLRAIAC